MKPDNYQFSTIVASSEQELNLAEAALVIAGEFYPHLDVAAYVARIDEMAERIRADLPELFGPVDVVRVMNHYLFVTEGFGGNLDDYTDPRNSFLNDVLDRKLGIPITLCVIYLEIGWRLGLPLQGVSFPGHFLVKFRHDEGEVILDPFFKGVSLDEDDLELRIQRLTRDTSAGNAELERFLGASTKKEILVRIMRNLRSVYVNDGAAEVALRYADRILQVNPNDALEILARAEILRSLNCFKPATEDYARYLELAPDSVYTSEVRGHLLDMQRMSRQLH